MRLVEEANKGPVQNGTNGNGVHASNGDESDSDSESDIEEAEPVSATLILRVVSEPPSPALSRKSSFRRDQPPAFLNQEARGGSFLQVILTVICYLSDSSSQRSKSKDQPQVILSTGQENILALVHQAQHHLSMLQTQMDKRATLKKNRKDNHNSLQGTPAGSPHLVHLLPCMDCLRLSSIGQSKRCSLFHRTYYFHV